MIIYVESQKDLTRTPVWDFNKAKFDFWEHGRVEIPKFEDFKVFKRLDDNKSDEDDISRS